jgi:hypothetical protein
VCGPGCGSRACPVGPPGPLRVRSRLAPPRGAAAGAS